jgi:hypothetical protein
MLLEIFSVALTFSIMKISTDIVLAPAILVWLAMVVVDGGSNSSGGSDWGPCRGHPEIINLLKHTGFVRQQV